MTKKMTCYWQSYQCFITLTLLLSTIQVTNGWFSQPSFTAFNNNNNNAVQQQPPDNVKLLILPGFGNDKNDYHLYDREEHSLVQSLLERGWRDENLHVLDVARTEWLNVFLRGLLDYQFWLGTASPYRPAFGWYIERIHNTLQQILDTEEQDNDHQVVLVCHSAGGWLARAALLDYNNKINGNKNRIAGLVTLGAPHIPSPMMDVTRGALPYTHDKYPSAMAAAEAALDDMFHITVAGTAVQGIEPKSKTITRNSDDEYKKKQEELQRIAYDTYKSVCGVGETIGDGVVPVDSAHLDGAIQLNLPNTYHSINAPQWYGSNTIIDLWHTVMIDELYNKMKQQSQRKNNINNKYNNINAITNNNNTTSTVIL